MAHLKKFQQDSKIFLSIVDEKNEKPQSMSSFGVHSSLCSQKSIKRPR